MNLSDFLLARIAEDEAVARKLPETRWYVDDDGCIETPIDTGPDGEDNLPNHHNSWYLALDPAHVLAECEAKRRMLVTLVAAHEASSVWITGDRGAILATTEAVLRLLALPYAEHPDYRPEWRP